MGKKTLIWILIFSLLINISVIATFSYYQWFTPEKGAKPTQRQRSKREGLYKRLGYTDEQLKKIKQQRKKLYEEIKHLKNQLDEHRKKIVILMQSDSISIEQIYTEIEKISNIEKSIQKKVISSLMESRTILSKDQRERFVKMIAQRMFGEEHNRSRHFKSRKRTSKTEDSSAVKSRK